MTKSNLETKGLFQFTALICPEGSQGRNSRQEPGRGNRSSDPGGTLFISFLGLLSYTIQDRVPRGGTTYTLCVRAGLCGGGARESVRMRMWWCEERGKH